MKKLLLLVLLASFNLVASAATKALVVTFDNGLTARYALADEPTVTVADDLLTVTITSGAVTTHPLATVLTFTFAETTGIDTPTTTPNLTRSGETIIISAPVAVTATTVSGAAVPVTVTRTATTTTIDLSSLPHGLTIVTAAGRAFKYTRP